MTDEQIVDRLRDWVHLRGQALALKRERAACLCVREADLLSREKPCWKDYREVVDAYGDREAELLNRKEWCASCLKRQEIHENLRAVTRSRGAVLRVLIQAGKESKPNLARTQGKPCARQR